jgi:hypothetical protein
MEQCDLRFLLQSRALQRDIQIRRWHVLPTILLALSLRAFCVHKHKRGLKPSLHALHGIMESFVKCRKSAALCSSIRRSTCERQSLHSSSAVSVSKSTTVSAGLSGISSAGARAYSDGNNAETESHSISFGQTSATAHGAVENGRAITNAASSAGISRSSAMSDADRFLSREGVALASARYPNRPRWSNVGPNNGQSE